MYTNIFFTSEHRKRRKPSCQKYDGKRISHWVNLPDSCTVGGVFFGTSTAQHRNDETHVNTVLRPKPSTIIPKHRPRETAPIKIMLVQLPPLLVRWDQGVHRTELALEHQGCPQDFSRPSCRRDMVLVEVPEARCRCEAHHRDHQEMYLDNLSYPTVWETESDQDIPAWVLCKGWVPLQSVECLDP